MNLYCPYCDHDCGDYFDDQNESNVDYEHECKNCGKIFQFSIEYYPSYTSWETPCLNGEEHEFKEICGIPKEYFKDKRRCKHCGKEITLKEAGEKLE